jgi:hypothetical protein
MFSFLNVDSCFSFASSHDCSKLPCSAKGGYVIGLGVVRCCFKRKYLWYDTIVKMLLLEGVRLRWWLLQGSIKKAALEGQLVS